MNPREQRNHRIIRSLPAVLCLLSVMMFQACALPPPVKKKVVVEKDPFDVFPITYRTKALQYEKEKELPMALISWQIVEGFMPGDREASDNISRLRGIMKAEAERNYRTAIASYEKRKVREARKNFLKALAYNPSQPEALEYLRNRLSPKEFVVYRIKEGDNHRVIAQKVYHDKRLAGLIAYFNVSPDGNAFTPGDSIRLPIMEPSPKPKKVHTESRLRKARALYEWKRYRDAISLSEDIIASKPSKAARAIIDGSYYALGVTEFKRDRLIRSLELFHMVPGTYKETGTYLKKIERKLAVKAESHYKKGMGYFLKEDLRKAIREWEAALHMNPDHQKAKSYLSKARAMLKNLQKLQ